MDKNEKEKNDKKEAPDTADDVLFEEEIEHTIADAESVIKRLKDRLRKTESEKQEYLDGWQRAKADYINVRRKDEETNKSLVKFAEERLMNDLLPVLDSFDQAFSHKDSLERLPDEWKDGVKNIYNQLFSILTQHGIKEINPLRETFDPTYHEALGVIETNKEEEDHMVLDVLQKGYVLHDKVMRTARVRIGRYIK